MKSLLAKLQKHGWKVIGSSGTANDEAGTETGTLDLGRWRGRNRIEEMSIPFTSTFTYGEPRITRTRKAHAFEPHALEMARPRRK